MTVSCRLGRCRIQTWDLRTTVWWANHASYHISLYFFLRSCLSTPPPSNPLPHVRISTAPPPQTLIPSTLHSLFYSSAHGSSYPSLCPLVPLIIRLLGSIAFISIPNEGVEEELLAPVTCWIQNTVYQVQAEQLGGGGAGLGSMYWGYRKGKSPMNSIVPETYKHGPEQDPETRSVQERKSSW